MSKDLFSTEVLVGFFCGHCKMMIDFFLDLFSAHLLPVFVQSVMGVVGHGGQKLQEAVESITVACRQQVDQ